MRLTRTLTFTSRLGTNCIFCSPCRLCIDVLFFPPKQLDSHLSATRTHSAHGYATLSVRMAQRARQANTFRVGYGARFVVRRCRGLGLRLASGGGRPLELVDATAHTYNCWGPWSTESVRAMRTATETDANVRTPNPTLHAPRRSPALKRQQGQLCPQKP